VTGGFGGIFASKIIRLIGNIYSQTMRIYICGERPLSYQSRPNSLVKTTPFYVHFDTKPDISLGLSNDI
jgi:hypothetical protein